MSSYKKRIYFEIYILVSFEQSVIRAFSASNNIKYTGENLAKPIIVRCRSGAAEPGAMGACTCPTTGDVHE
jgi:hypothetical protein